MLRPCCLSLEDATWGSKKKMLFSIFGPKAALAIDLPCPLSVWSRGNLNTETCFPLAPVVGFFRHLRAAAWSLMIEQLQSCEGADWDQLKMNSINLSGKCTYIFILFYSNINLLALFWKKKWRVIMSFSWHWNLTFQRNYWWHQNDVMLRNMELDLVHGLFL